MDDIVPAEPVDRELLLIRNLFLGMNLYQAGIQAGYSESTAKSTLYQQTKTKRFRTRLRQYAIDNDIESLPKIAFIENKILDLLVEDPEQYVKFKDVIKQKKQVAGVLAPDDTPKQQIINVKGVRELLVHVHQQRREPEQITDAEVVDNDSS